MQTAAPRRICSKPQLLTTASAAYRDISIPVRCTLERFFITSFLQIFGCAAPGL